MTDASAKTDAAPELRPYLPATSGFTKGEGSPRDFLERAIRALGAWEPKIGAFVTLNLAAARAAADRADRALACRQAAVADRRHAGRHQGHHRDRSTCRPRTARRCSTGYRTERDGASVAALREAGAVIVGKTVTTEFAVDRAARHPQPARPDAHAGRLVERLGGGRRCRHDRGRARHAGDRLDRPAVQLLRLLRLQADGRRDQSRRQLRWAERKASHGPIAASLPEEPGCRLRDRAARRRRPGLSGAVRAGDPPAAAAAQATSRSRDRRLGGRIARRESRDRRHDRSDSSAPASTC